MQIEAAIFHSLRQSEYRHTAAPDEPERQPNLGLSSELFLKIFCVDCLAPSKLTALVMAILSYQLQTMYPPYPPVFKSSENAWIWFSESRNEATEGNDVKDNAVRQS